MSSAPTAPVLDALVWHALTSVHARFAEGGDVARRYNRDVAPFVAVSDHSPAAWRALAELAGPSESVMLVRDDELAPPLGWTLEGGGYGHQMIAERLGPAPTLSRHREIVELRERDVPQMLALVALTEPGPFRSRTIELGNYCGIFDDGELIAMAGERLQTPCFTEVSAVCTHPSARGQGLAAALTHHVAAGIGDRGQTPILHVAVQKTQARRVYERLGFSVRRELAFVATRTPSSTVAPARMAQLP